MSRAYFVFVIGRIGFMFISANDYLWSPGQVNQPHWATMPVVERGGRACVSYRVLSRIHRECVVFILCNRKWCRQCRARGWQGRVGNLRIPKYETCKSCIRRTGASWEKCFLSLCGSGPPLPSVRSSELRSFSAHVVSLQMQGLCLLAATCPDQLSPTL